MRRGEGAPRRLGLAGKRDVLYHFSEEPGIVAFEPRPPLARPEVVPLVWAIDEWHAPHFYFPRDCPRLNFWAPPGTAPPAGERFLRGACRVAVIEEAWLERLRTTRLYQYVFDPAPFEPVDDVAGYWVSRAVVRPLRVDLVEDLPRQLAGAGVELRTIAEGLVAYHLEVVASGLEFSSSRLRNAADADLVPGA